MQIFFYYFTMQNTPWLQYFTFKRRKGMNFVVLIVCYFIKNIIK
ncbi:hypothetical protein SAMN03080601_01227 [Alkalitalea saponilacus]|uniref:Uncharacterized protein n=1 Tax=Alkalitalea saponilacus TaxID=889453 RepID=A0A1T5E7I0_9BACT|nr:hypothetical protein SAMN03080601_01227 [Alkalitalea saponilacus]